MKDIQKNFKMDDKEREVNVQATNKIVDWYVGKMKEVSGLFKLLYNRPLPTGSSFSGLRITDANEFDMNIVLHLPFKKPEMWKVTFPKAGYAEMCVMNKNLAPTEVPDNWRQHLPDIQKRLLDSEGYIRPAYVRSWAQSLVDRVPKDDSPQKIWVSSSGPARTLHFFGDKGRQVDVDLAFVFEVVDPHWEKRLKRFNPKSAEKARKANPDKKVTLVPTDEVDLPKSWRINFPAEEKAILAKYSAVLPVIKILKALRDAQDWKVLKSHFIKTLVMQEIVTRHPDSDYWVEDHLGSLFMKMLEILASKVAVSGGITMIWDPGFNYLYGKKDQVVLDNLKHRLEKIIKIIKQKYKEHPSEVLKLFIQHS